MNWVWMLRSVSVLWLSMFQQDSGLVTGTLAGRASLFLCSRRRHTLPSFWAPSLHNYPGNCGVIGAVTCSQDTPALFYQQLESNLREKRDEEREKERHFRKKEGRKLSARGTVTLSLWMEMYENALFPQPKKDKNERRGSWECRGREKSKIAQELGKENQGDVNKQKAERSAWLRHSGWEEKRDRVYLEGRKRGVSLCFSLTVSCSFSLWGCGGEESIWLKPGVLFILFNRLGFLKTSRIVEKPCSS